ncbi:MAG: hypothetical protein DME88_05710 [Verrucomicrobia bacterium]|nr:MAG: hypothetical protein DME88_05710 [Verrucomicrobiota bacterium]
MGCRMIRHVARVHSKIKTAQAHEIRHVYVVDRGTMISFLVGDHKFAPFRRITRSPSRALRAIHRHAVLKESDALQSERNFEAQAIRRWSAAKKNLCSTPVARFSGNIQRRHFVSTRQSAPVGTCVDQTAQVVILSKPGGKHRDGDVPVFFHVAAKPFRREHSQKILVRLRGQNRVRVGSTSQKRAEKRGVVSRNGVGKKRHLLPLRCRRR